MSKLRLDRIASLYLFHPLARSYGPRSRPRVPILMYHSIQDGAPTRHPYYETNTSPRVFALQMKYLRDNGYQALDLEAATCSLEKGQSLEKRVVITFDDGYRDFYTTAYPILKENNLSASVFLIARFTSEQSSRVSGKECMTWNQVRELYSDGICFGSHSMTHPQLKSLSATEVDKEVGCSKLKIEDEIGCPVRSFSYPFAFPETERAFICILKNCLQRHGYKNGVCTIIGTARSDDDRFFLPRLPVNTWDDLKLFRAKLEGGYDWVHGPQHFYKSFLKRPTPATRAIEIGDDF